MAGKNQLTGGLFQDCLGNPLNLGYLIMELSQDEQLSAGQGEACAGIKIRILLNSSGSVSTSPAQSVWTTDQMNPAGASYTVWAYTSAGQLAWGPNYGLLVPSSPSPFDVGTWVPNQIGGSGGGSSSNLLLQTNGVNNGDQNLLNLAQGSGITLVDNGTGTVTISGGGSNGPRSRMWNGWTPDGSDGLNPGSGFGTTVDGSNTGTGAAYTGLSPTATVNKMLSVNTGTGSNNLNFFSASGNTHTANDAVSLGVLGLAECRIALGGTTTIRNWVGLGRPKSGSNFYKSDAPAIAAVAFRYSTAAGDSNFMCIVTDGTTLVSADSGVPADTAPHTFGFTRSGTNILFFIDGAQVGTVSLSTTTLTNASGFQLMSTVDNVGTTNDVSMAIEYFYWDTTT